MWILELQIVLLLEILSYGALHGLAVLKLQGEPVNKWEMWAKHTVVNKSM